MANGEYAPACFTRREPLAVYLAQHEYASSSSLRRFLRTGVASTTTVNPVPQSASLGDALHAVMLEPERFEQEYVRMDAVQPQVADEAALMNRTWLNNQQSLQLHAMQKSIRYFTRAPLQQWFDQGKKELSIYWTDESGAKWKARPDCFTDDVILELKTTGDVRPKKFAKSRRHFGYDLQAAHYLDGVGRFLGKRPRFLFVSVESSKPHTVWLHEFDIDAQAAALAKLATAREQFRAALLARPDAER